MVKCKMGLHIGISESADRLKVYKSILEYILLNIFGIGRNTQFNTSNAGIELKFYI